MRMEASSQYVAQVDGKWNDSTLEIEYAATYGFNVDVEYSPSATRSGISIEVRHQAAAAYNAVRTILDIPNIRAVAFQNRTISTTGVGFEKMCLLSSNPSGPPTTLNGFCAAGLSNIGLNSETVQLPTSRALAVVVDCSVCKEFFFAFEGNNLRPVFLQFDSNENLLQNAHPITLSNANVVWNPLGTSYWWEMSANLDQLVNGYLAYKYQRVRFHPSAAYGVIGVRGGDSVNPANNIVKAVRIYTSPIFFPQIIYGNTRSWGEREYTATFSITIPSLGPGAVYQQNFTVPGAREGDFVQAGFDFTGGFQNGGIVAHAVTGGTSGNDSIAVTFQNLSAGTINLSGATTNLWIRGVRPRV
jgi:hypothetical protein